MKREKGFTLIELLIAVTIIGFLAAIAIPAYIGSQEKARKSNLIKAALSSESDLQHWLSSAIKGASATPQASHTEVDTNWDGQVTSSDDNNSTLFGAGPAALVVANSYANVRTDGTGMNGAERSPWAGMDLCASDAGLFVPTTDPGANNIGEECQITLTTDTTDTSIAIIATSNGPGGIDTANAELLSRIVVSAE